MALTMYTGNDELSVGNTTATIATAASPYFYVENNPPVAQTIYYRIIYSTASDLSSPSYSSPAKSQALNGFDTIAELNQNIDLTGLSTSTTYYYKCQISTDNVNFTTGTGSNGSFTTGSGATAAPTADFTYNTNSGLAPLYVEFSDISTASPAATAWAWAISGYATTYTVQDPWHYFTSAGTYTVTQTVTNAIGTDSEVKTGIITVVSGAPVATWTQNTTIGTRPLTVTFTDGSTNSPTSWKWSLPDGIGIDTPISQNYTKVYPSAGTYAVTHTATNFVGSGSASSASAVTVRPISVQGTFTGSNVVGDAPLSVQFLATVTGDTTSVLWNFGDSVTATGTTATSHAYYGTGTFTPTFTVYGVTSPVAAVTTVSTATQTNLVTVSRDRTYRAFLEDLRRQLLLNTDITSLCDDFVSWGGASTVLKHVYNRICRLQLETGILRKTSTTITGSSGTLDLPTDLIEIRSIYVNGYRLEKVDPRMADLAEPTWISRASGDYLGWYTNPSDHLKLHLVPPVNPSTFEVYYVYAPTVPTVPSPCTNAFGDIPIPYVYWWVVKYGVLSDLLRQEGDMYDLERADLCEKLWQEGIQMIQLTMDGK